MRERSWLKRSSLEVRALLLRRLEGDEEVRGVLLKADLEGLYLFGSGESRSAPVLGRSSVAHWGRITKPWTPWSKNTRPGAWATI